LIHSTNPVLTGIHGRVINETKNMLIIENSKSRELKIPKADSEFLFRIPAELSEKGRRSDEFVKIQGNLLPITTRKSIKNIKKLLNGAKLMARDIGLNIPAPSKECEDLSCPFHGALSVRGQILVGTVVSSKEDNTVVIEGNT